ncbi:MAG: hypothetical protein AAFX01_00235 [Cyanobacteria bacterium J06638_28]
MCELLGTCPQNPQGGELNADLVPSDFRILNSDFRILNSDFRILNSDFYIPISTIQAGGSHTG